MALMCIEESAQFRDHNLKLKNVARIALGGRLTAGNPCHINDSRGVVEQVSRSNPRPIGGLMSFRLLWIVLAMAVVIPVSFGIDAQPDEKVTVARDIAARV